MRPNTLPYSTMHAPTSRPDRWLLLLKGHPCSGKSTLARALARRLAWPLLDKDDIKDHIAALPDGNILAYTILWAVVRRQLAQNLSVIVDSPLSYPIGYDTGRRLAAEATARLLVVELTLDEATWRARLEQRARTETGHKIAGWPAMQTLLHQYAGCWQYPILPQHHLPLASSLPVDQLCAAVLARLAPQPAAICTQG